MQSVSAMQKKGEDGKGGLDPLAAATALLNLPDSSQSTLVRTQYDGDRVRPVLESDTVVYGDTIYNTRGYEVCGVQNQHGKPCRRIGKCPFHDGAKSGQKDGAAAASGSSAPPAAAGATPAAPQTPSTAPGAPKPSQLQSEHGTMGPPPTVAAPPRRLPFKTGWSKEEHIRFLNGLQIHGKGAWKEIAQIVGSRNATQVQSHAQKYFMRQKQEKRNKRSIHDLSVEDLHDLPSEQGSSRSAMVAAAHAAMKGAGSAANLIIPSRSAMNHIMMSAPPFASAPSFSAPSSFSPAPSFSSGTGAFSGPASFSAIYGQPHAQSWYYPPVFPSPTASGGRLDAHDDGSDPKQLPLARNATHELHALAAQAQGSTVLLPQPLDRQPTINLADMPAAGSHSSLSGLVSRESTTPPKRRNAEGEK